MLMVIWIIWKMRLFQYEMQLTYHTVFSRFPVLPSDSSNPRIPSRWINRKRNIFIFLLHLLEQFGTQQVAGIIDIIRVHGLETRIKSFAHPRYGHMMHGVERVSVLPTNEGLVSNILASELTNIPYKRPRCTKASLSYDVVGLSVYSVVHVTPYCPVFILIPCAIIISTRSLHLVSLL